MSMGPRDIQQHRYYQERRVLKDVLLVWVDGTIDEKEPDCQNTLEKLRAVINDVKLFGDIDTCVEFFMQIDMQKVLVITSGSLGPDLMGRVHSMDQVDSVYVLCGNIARHEKWVKEWKKIRGVYNGMKPLCQALQETFK